MPALVRCLSALLAVVVLAGCARGGDGEVAWRDLSLALPDGWVVFEDAPTRFSLASEPLGAALEEGERPSGEAAAMWFTHRPGTTPAAWREQIAASGATLEVDEAVEVGGVPATRLQFLTPAADGTPATRELVVLVPAREVELIAQPVVGPGGDRAPTVFDRHVATFDAVLASVRWGVPYDG